MLDLLDLLLKLEERLNGTPIEPYINYVSWAIIIILLLLLGITVNRIFMPLWRSIRKVYDRYSRRKFISGKIYDKLSFMESSDVFYAIEQFVPTRFSLNNDAANDDEPSPDYHDSTQDKGRLLIEHFCKYELDIKTGRKYYLCLADCGMGKTTFLINLYYRIIRAGKYQCEFISLQDIHCLNSIDSISEKGKTILLLDALDENTRALANYIDFIDELEKKTREFYRVVITSRTNFFENESKEKLSNQQKISGITSKISNMKKFYITPFTDDDIKRYLRIRYRWNRKKQKSAWQLIDRNKNLSVRPMLLRFMDEVLSENQDFEYDFQLYECLFQKWIDRERDDSDDCSANALYDECLSLAKVIYYQWRKNGQIGIMHEDLANYSISGLEDIQIKGHAILNRTNTGLYKFSHRSYWEYMLAKLALSDVFFACELLIKNFDRAVSFLEEMIQYYQNHPDEITVEITLGIANYMLKYGKLENAEKYYSKILEEKKGDNIQTLLAMIQLVKCLQREFKFKSAYELLNQCTELIDKIPLSKEVLPIYVQFGNVYADYCNVQHIKEGQLFLNNIIDFCKKQDILEYSLLKCYELYCQYGINYFYQQQAMVELEKLMLEAFKGDQYAAYIYNCAQIRCLDLRDMKSFGILAEIVNNGHIFMDSYEQVSWYGELGIYSAALGEWDNISVKCFNDSHNISDSIYKNKCNVYSLLIYQKLLKACNLFEPDEQQLLVVKNDINEQCMDFIVDYIETKQLQEEISVMPFIEYGYIQKHIMGLPDHAELAAEKRLEIESMSKNVYNIVDAHLECFYLYVGNTLTREQAKDHLQAAYKSSQDQAAWDYRETTAYCNLLQTILCFNDEVADKDYIARILLDIMPGIYGKDKRASDIYKTLQGYFSSNNDSREVKACLAWLYCDFDFDKLIYFYDSCVKNNQSGSFFKELESVLAEKGIFSEIEELDIQKFLSVKRNELVIDTGISIENLLKKNRSIRERDRLFERYRYY